ncbi:MAG TPA: DegT/DnrJ/EryC1/StrS family aminotransferase [bacterium]|nr:DegT/DnrJ/EryC1/StrS family aminotransferase [bacterium]
MIAHSRPTIGPEDVDGVARVLQSGHLAQGSVVADFEAAVAGYLGRRGGVATNSGTAALHLALLTLDVGPGDEVLLPSYTCVALLHAVRHVGATPRLVDLAEGEYAMCPREAGRLITSRTRAMIVPHMFGVPADLDALCDLGVPVIEDCAQSLGATYQGRPAGGAGVITVCSFYATKVITTGEGGMLLSNSEVVLRRARDLRDYDGRGALPVRFNYKMTDMQAALGLSQFGRLSAFLVRRRALAARYHAALRDLPLVLPYPLPQRSHIYYRYVVGIRGAAEAARALRELGVECKPPVPRPLHALLGQRGFDRTEHAAATALSLPLYPSLTDDQAEIVLRAAVAVFTRKETEQRLLTSSAS